MFFNGFTLLLCMLSVFGGFVLGVKVEIAHRANQVERWINGETIEAQMARDGWKL
jgi:hypothetical protein